MVHNLLSPDKDVLDAGCGHGEFTLTLAGRCQASWLMTGVRGLLSWRNKPNGAKIHNVRFMLWDSSEDVHGKGRLPAEDNSMDVMISPRPDQLAGRRPASGTAWRSAAAATDAFGTAGLERRAA
jgi:hypothetical protein